jgi:hypothetical protein
VERSQQSVTLPVVLSPRAHTRLTSWALVRLYGRWVYHGLADYNTLN